MDGAARTLLLAELVERHYAVVYRYAYRLSGSADDAEDLTQQTFLQAQERLGQLREPGAGRAWLCTICRNQYLQGVRREIPAIGSLDLVAEPVESASLITGEIDHERLQRLLNELPEEYRSPLILYYFEDFSYREIAGHMEVPIGTVMSRLSRAKAWLRQRLVDNPQPESPHGTNGRSGATVITGEQVGGSH